MKSLIFGIGITLLGALSVQAQEIVTGISEEYNQAVNLDHAIPSDVFLSRIVKTQKDMEDVTVKGTVEEVCTVKGCWLTMKGTKAANFRVMFDDHRSFATKELIGKEVVIKGDAEVTELSEEEIAHYKEDAGDDGAEVKEIEVFFTAKSVIIP